MKLNELLKPGDVIHSQYHVAHYIVDNKVVWNRVAKCEDDLDYCFDYSTLPNWIKFITRGTVNVTEQIRQALNTSIFKFGDRVVDNGTPKSDAVFLEYVSDDTLKGWALVAYDDSHEQVVVQKAPVKALSHKE